MPEERRVALDLLDVRESIEEFGDKIRWIPTDHMLVDCMTKNMPPDAMMGYMKSMEYAFKYDDVIKETKREIAKARKALRSGTVPKVLEETELEEVSIVEHYPVYYAMFNLLRMPPDDTNILVPTSDIYRHHLQQRLELGYRQAYRALMVTLTTGSTTSSESSE